MYEHFARSEMAQMQELNALGKDYVARDSEEDSSIEGQESLFGYVSTNLQVKKPKPKFMTPFNKFIDREQLKRQHLSKKQQVKRLERVNTELRQKYSQAVLARREIEEALYKLSQVLPAGHQKEEGFLGKQKQAMQKKSSLMRESLAKFRKSSKTTSIFQLNIFKQHLQEHSKRIQRELKYIAMEVQDQQQEMDLKPDEQEFLNIQLANVQACQTSWALDAKSALLNQRAREENIVSKLIDVRIKNCVEEIKIKKERLQEIKLRNSGLIYEEELFKNARQQIHTVQEEIRRLRSNAVKQQKAIAQSRANLDDKNNVLGYVKKWNEQLINKIDQKKQAELVTKAKLEFRINILSKEFQQWSSKYKVLAMQNQALRPSRRDNDPKSSHSQKHTYNPKLRATKEYQVQPICKRINYEMCLNGICKQQFISSIVGTQETVSVKSVFENLKKSLIVSEQFFPKLLLMAKYIAEDNFQDGVSVSFHTKVKTKTARAILSTMIGNVMYPETMEAESQHIKKMMERNYWTIMEKMPSSAKTDMILEQRLRESFAYLGTKLTSNLFKVVCIKMYEYDKTDVFKYSLSTFKRLFQRYAYKKPRLSENMEVIDL